jgi:YidC/Oxa1 family membrane protein insertase
MLLKKTANVRSFSCVPSDILGDILQSVHSHGGLSWGYTIVASTLLFRIGITLPLAILQRKNQQRLHLVQPLTKAWANTIRKSTDSDIFKKSQSKSLLNPSYNFSKKDLNERFRNRITFIHKQVNCHPLKEVILPLIQIPFFISTTAAIRELLGTSFLWINASEPALGMATEGFAWFPNLLESDPSLITPILCGLFHFINGEIIFKEKLSNLNNSSRSMGIMAGNLLNLNIFD